MHLSHWVTSLEAIHQITGSFLCSHRRVWYFDTIFSQHSLRPANIQLCKHGGVPHYIVPNYFPSSLFVICYFDPNIFIFAANVFHFEILIFGLHTCAHTGFFSDVDWLDLFSGLCRCVQNGRHHIITCMDPPTSGLITQTDWKHLLGSAGPLTEIPAQSLNLYLLPPFSRPVLLMKPFMSWSGSSMLTFSGSSWITDG